jgi:Uma2 family endonuclease
MEEEMSASALPKRKRFTVEEFQRMGEAGVFAPDERVELIDGEIIEMTPVGPRHVQAVFALDDFFRSVVGPEIRVATQNALRTPAGLPWPDAALLVRSRLDPARLPGADACILVVEVADATARLDRGRKRRAYAQAGIPEYWVVDLRSDSVVLHLSPAGGDYAEVREFGAAASFVSPALGGREVRVAEVLGGRG